MPLSVYFYIDWESQVASGDVSKLMELLDNTKQTPIKVPTKPATGRCLRAVVRNDSAVGAQTADGVFGAKFDGPRSQMHFAIYTVFTHSVYIVIPTIVALPVVGQILLEDIFHFFPSNDFFPRDPPPVDECKHRPAFQISLSELRTLPSWRSNTYHEVDKNLRLEGWTCGVMSNLKAMGSFSMIVRLGAWRSTVIEIMSSITRVDI